jgi:hypothetical protein
MPAQFSAYFLELIALERIDFVANHAGDRHCYLPIGVSAHPSETGPRHKVAFD